MFQISISLGHRNSHHRIVHTQAHTNECFQLQTKEDLKNKEIEILKLKYDNGLMDFMDYMLEVSKFVKNFD